MECGRIPNVLKSEEARLADLAAKTGTLVDTSVGEYVTVPGLTGIARSVHGKYIIQIYHTGDRKNICLGTTETVRHAVNVYNAMAAECGRIPNVFRSEGAHRAELAAKIAKLVNTAGVEEGADMDAVDDEEQ